MQETRNSLSFSLVLTVCVPSGSLGPVWCPHASFSSCLWQREGLPWARSRPHPHHSSDWERWMEYDFNNKTLKHRCVPCLMKNAMWPCNSVFRPSTERCVTPPHPWLFTFRCIMVSCRRLACWLWGGAPTPPLTPMGFAPRRIETTQHCECSSSNNNVIHFALRQVSMSSHYVELKVYSWDVRQTEGMRIQLHLVWNLLFVNATTAATWDILFSK